MLARIAKADPKLLNPVKHRSRECRQDLAVIKARDILVKSSTMMINYIVGTLKTFGVKTDEFKPDNFPEGILKFIPRELLPALICPGDFRSETFPERKAALIIYRACA